MSVSGNWKTTVNYDEIHTFPVDSPLGVQTGVLSIAANGDRFSGEMADVLGRKAIAGSVDGDKLTWSVALSDPMPMTLEYGVVVDGDTMTGDVRAGPFGGMKLKAVRA